MRNSHNSNVKKKEQRNKQRFDKHSSKEHKQMTSKHIEIVKVMSHWGSRNENEIWAYACWQFLKEDGSVGKDCEDKEPIETAGGIKSCFML